MEKVGLVWLDFWDLTIDLPLEWYSTRYYTNFIPTYLVSKMPRKEQGWITFQSSDEERRILEQVSQQTQRTKTEILREMIRQMGRSGSSDPLNVNSMPSASLANEFSEELEVEGEEAIASVSFANGSLNTATLQTVQISARNILRAKVKRMVKGAVNAEVTLEIAPGVELVSIITRTSADKLGLKKGKQVFAMIKSSSVMIATA